MDMLNKTYDDKYLQSVVEQMRCYTYSTVDSNIY